MDKIIINHSFKAKDFYFQVKNKFFSDMTMALSLFDLARTTKPEWQVQSQVHGQGVQLERHEEGDEGGKVEVLQESPWGGLEIVWSSEDHQTTRIWKVEALWEVVNLAEIYDLEVKKLLAKYSQIPETVIPASAAEMFSHFKEISSKLFIHCTTFLLATKVLTTKQLASINRYSSLCCNSQAAQDGVRGLPIMSTVTPACWWCAMTDFLCPCQTRWRDAGCLSGWGPVGWKWLGGWWTNVGSIVDPCGWSGSEDL